MEQPALEHGSTRSDRWLRRYRLRIAFWVAVVEAILLVAGVIDRWAVLFFALLAIVGYFVVGARLRSGVARDALWTAAVSQALVALVPILVILVGTFALIAVGILAVVALVILFGDRH
ncbi:MAG TPA: hypothetical protein VNB86_06240 [Gaiellaceae bacterium]|jgi:hypothetical protein|nr:hypothetical protein [Gaiellaceae bacterium]